MVIISAPKSRMEQKPERIFSYWFFSVPTGFFSQHLGFFFIKRHKSKMSRPIIGSASHRLIKPFVVTGVGNLSLSFSSKKWLIRSPVTKLLHDSRKKYDYQYTRSHHETKQGIFRVFTHKKNPIFCRIADFIPLSLSHFFPLKNFHFYDTLLL